MTTPQPQQKDSYRELRTKIGEILVKNNLRTDQVAISELAKVVATELALQRRELEQKHHDRLLVIQSIVMQSVVLAINNFSAGRPKEAFKKLEGLRKYGKERLIKRGME